MRILFISQYFIPEIGAASERITSLTFNLSKLGHKVTVITGFPNYPIGEYIRVIGENSFRWNIRMALK